MNASFGAQKARRLWNKARRDGRQDADGATESAHVDGLAREVPEEERVEDVAQRLAGVVNNMHHCLVLTWKPFGQINGTDVNAASGGNAKADKQADHDPVARGQKRAHEEEALGEARAEEEPATANLVGLARHIEQRQAPEKVEGRTDEASLPVGLAHEVKLLNPVVKRSTVRPVDVPGGDLGVLVTDVLTGAEPGVGVLVGENACVLLLLDEERD